jgi:hypothetical protein
MRLHKQPAVAAGALLRLREHRVNVGTARWVLEPLVIVAN